MTFTETYSAILSPFVQPFKEATTEKEKKALIKDAVDAVKKSKALLEDTEDLPKELVAVVRRCLKTSAEKDVEGEVAASKSKVQNQKPKKVKPTYAIRDVVKENYRSLIDSEIPYPPGEPEYICRFQAAVTKVLNNMSEEDLEEAEKVVEQWNKEGAPSEVQLRRARKKLPKEIQKKLDEWKFNSGALMICLVAYPCGDSVRSYHVESAPLQGNHFTTSYPDWREGTYVNFQEWASKQLGVKEPDSEDEAEVPVHLQKAKNLQFEKNGRGDFILPPLSNYRTVREKQRVVRGYIGAVYRKSTGSKIASFPYLLASKENQTVFDPQCVPKGFVLSDPDHLHGSQIISLYNHWLRRQARKLSPFVVLKSPPHQGLEMSAKARGKRKMEYVEVNSEDEEVKSMGEKEDRSEGDPSDDEEDDFGEKVISAGVMKVGPPTGNVTSSSKQPLSKARDDPQVAGPSSVPSKGKSIKANGQKEVNQLVAQKKIAWSKQPQNIDAQADKPRDDRSKLEQSAKKAKSTKSSVEAKVKPGPAKASKDNRTRQSGRAAEEAPATDPSPAVRGKKRKAPSAEDELPSLEQAGKSGRKPPKPAVEENLAATQRGKKRKAAALDDELASPKRKRLSPPARLKEATANPVSPQTKARGSGRVRDFPAGNVTTSASRRSFLQTLCPLPKFRSMVDLIAPLPKPSPIPESYPDWASWSSKEAYLPAAFHSAKSFKKVLATLNDSFNHSAVFEDRTIDAPLLLLGLTFREISRAMEVEDGESAKLPPQLVASTLGIREMQKIEDMLESVVLP